MTNSSPLIGRRLGPYEVLARLGAGGMGEVFKARDTRLDRTVAVKTLPSHLAGAADWRERFEREARAISQLSHANICTLFDVGEQDGTAFLVMEHLEGETLADRLARGPIPIDQALKWAMQVASALHAAHRQGILHRDLKPGNIMVTRETIKLLDFGLAKIVAAGENGVAVTAPPTQSPLTAQGTILGTYQYMAPEVVEGDDADARADIWAFGCVLYEMLTGRRAFAGKSQASLFGAILKEEAPSVSAAQPLASPALDRIVRTCLAKDPNQRVQSAHDLLLNLQWVAEGGSAAGVPAPVVAHRKSRERMMWAAIALAVGVGGAAAAWIAKPSPVQSNIVTRFVHTLDSTVRFTRTGRHSLAISPDGTFFVYVANGQLFIRRMNEVDAQPIKGTEEDPFEPVVSPDGTSIAYFVSVPGGAGSTLKKIPVTGGAPSTLATLTFAPFGVGWQDDVIVIGQGRDGIVSVPAAGGTPQSLVTVQAGEWAASPQLIGSGSALLFTLKKPTVSWNESDIVAQPVAGGERTVVIQGGHDGRVLPTGHLLYARDGTVFGARFDGRSRERLGESIPLIVGVANGTNPNLAGPAHFGVSLDGRLAYVPGSSDANERRTITWVDRQGREATIAAEARAYVYARIAPDGTRIALDANDTRRDIWIWNTGRDTLTRLAPQDAGPKLGPAWSPDSRSLFYAVTDGGRAFLNRRAADGTGASERLMEDKAGQMIPTSVSPDGQTVVHMSQYGSSLSSFDIKALTLTGGRAHVPVAVTPRAELNGEISPDGRWIAFETDETGRREIYVRPFPSLDAGRWQVSNTGGIKPAWSRNGRELFYLSDGQMMAVPISVGRGSEFAFGRPARLFSTRDYYNGLQGRNYDVAADGRFVFIKQPADATTNLSIVVVTNWLDEVRQRLGR